MVDVPEYKKEDFLESTAPYEFILSFQNPFEQAQICEKVKTIALSEGVRNFMTLFKEYKKQLAVATGGRSPEDNYTEFSGLDRQYKCGMWYCTDDGVMREGGFGMAVTACEHPILPVKRLINLDTGTCKLEIAFTRDGENWKKIIVENAVIANSQKIIELANMGVSVTSDNARELSKYLMNMESLNYKDLTVQNSIERLGWISSTEFSPYVDNLVFDGEASFKELYNFVQEKGTLEKWIENLKAVRGKHDKVAQIVIAASFASALVEVCNALPFFVHLYGGSGNGKSVTLCYAASVWAMPDIGQYVRTFNSTDVSRELTAAFLNSMPYCLDELQIEKGKTDFDKMIYRLCEGVSKARGRKSGGLQASNRWRNCMLTSGEYPILNERTGGGAANRVVQISCTAKMLYDDVKEAYTKSVQNYGFAGRKFVEWLTAPENRERAKKIQAKYEKKLTETEATGKQALSGSLILAADEITTELFFKDGQQLTVDEIRQYLLDAEAMNQNSRCLNFIYEYVSSNFTKFADHEDGSYFGEIYGRADEEKNVVYFIKSQFDKILEENGYNSGSFLEWAKANNLLLTAEKRLTTTVRIGSQKSPVRCVAIIRKDAEELENYENELL